MLFILEVNCLILLFDSFWFIRQGKCMTRIVEESLKHCRRCGKETVHRRNNTKTGLLMFLVHLVLTVLTWGAWLVLVVIWAVLNAKIGGWACSECGRR